MRLMCEIFRNGKAMPGKVFDVLNEIVVDRGSNPYLSKIECYERDQLITKVRLLNRATEYSLLSTDGYIRTQYIYMA